MRDYLPLLTVAAGLVAVVGLYLGAWLAFFKLIALLKRMPGPIGWVARRYRYRNQITVLRLRWLMPLWSKPYPRLILNMTQNGPSSFTKQWTRNFRTNNKRGWALNTPGGGSLRGGRQEKELPGDVAKQPTFNWVKTGAYAEEPPDEHGNFPIHEAKKAYDGWTLCKHRRPGTERGWIYWWDGTDDAHFRTQPDALKAVGWEPVVAQKKHQATATPEYTEWPDEMFEART